MRLKIVTWLEGNEVVCKVKKKKKEDRQKWAGFGIGFRIWHIWIRHIIWKSADKWQSAITRRWHKYMMDIFPAKCCVCIYKKKKKEMHKKNISTVVKSSLSLVSCNEVTRYSALFDKNSLCPVSYSSIVEHKRIFNGCLILVVNFIKLPWTSGGSWWCVWAVHLNYLIGYCFIRTYCVFHLTADLWWRLLYSKWLTAVFREVKVN